MAEEKSAVVDKEGHEDQPESSNVEERLSKLEKLLTDTARTLEEERKASAGKDRKITELADEKRRLQESTLSKDKLLEIREQEQKDREKEWADKNAAERMELEQLRIKNLRTEVLAGLENFPMFFADRVRGTNKEEIETDARLIMQKWVKERDKVDNARKVTGRPQSGSGKQAQGKSTEDVRGMSPKDQQKWAETAPDEEFKAVFEEMHAE